MGKTKLPLLKQNRTILSEKLKESLSSVLPVTGIVFLLCFSISPVPNSLLMGFVLGALLLILGMGLFTLGTDLAMTPIGSRMRLEFLVPTRGLFGYRNEFLTDTRGEGIMASTLDSYAPVKGEISRRLTGSLVAFETGETTAYGIGGVQDRGSMFIGPGVEVYAGMIVGQCNRNEDMAVNVCKKKQLTNMRAAGSDAAIRLVPPVVLSLEQCMEYLADDELLEVTPKSLRMRKRQLDHAARMRTLMKSRQ